MWMAVLQELVHRNMTEEMRHRAQKAEQQAQKEVRQAQGPPPKSLWQASDSPQFQQLDVMAAGVCW